MIKAEIIADSFNPAGNRLTTFVLEYPRFVHAELMTHRVFSKNASSSRAIPIEKMIEMVETNPALPVFWGKNQSGMQAAEQLDDTNKTEDWYYDEYMGGGASRTETEKVTPLEKAKRIWLDSRNKAVAQVKLLNQVGLHKQIANRILEPWLHIRIILSGTEFENWFALRVHKDAQPEICALATKMLELYNASEPKYLKDGEWHIPFGDNFNKENLHALNVQTFGLTKSAVYYYKQEEELKKKIAVARCARISYLNFEGKDDYSADIKLCDRLFANNPKHLSPTEHVAQAQGNSDWSGNFKGFKQFRKFFPQENLTDPRVINKFKL